MKYLKISLYSNKLLTLEERKKYINSFYNDYSLSTDCTNFKLGFFEKFNNAVGFKTVKGIDNSSTYISPKELLSKVIRTPLTDWSIIEFYLPNTYIKHFDEKYSYDTKDIANKWVKFLKKVFVELEVSLEKVESYKKIELKDFSLEYFYRNIDKEIRYTLEFASDKLLEKLEIDFILSKLQGLCNYNLSINQFECDLCKEYSNGKKPYHIELEYDIDVNNNN